jgi:hypothetical protein
MPAARKTGTTSSLVKFDPGIRERLERYADHHGIGITAAIRTLVVQGLDRWSPGKAEHHAA